MSVCNVYTEHKKSERWSCCSDVCLQVVQACDDPGDVGASAGLGKLRLKNAATPLTKAVVSSGGDGTAMGIEHMVLILGDARWVQAVSRGTVVQISVLLSVVSILVALL